MNPNDVLSAWSDILNTNVPSYDHVMKEWGDPFTSAIAADVLRVNYAVHPIRKKNGGSRQIEAPNKEMKRVQRVLLSQMKDRFDLHPAATAVVGKSYVDNATPHVAAKHVFKTDIMDFYPTTTKKKVDAVLRDHFPEEQEWMNSRAAFFYYRDGDLLDLRLPTGAPTSPFIGNLVLYPVDKSLETLATTYGAKYTRYLDDITLSFDQYIDPVKMNDIRNEVCAILIKNQWQPHPRKTRWIDPTHDRFTVTGVDVRNEQKVTGKYIRQKLRHVIERHIRESIVHQTYVLPKFLHNRRADQFNTFEDVLPVFFVDVLPLLGYVRQVSKEQYSQQVERARVRLNRICELEQMSLYVFTVNTISKLSTYFHIYDQQVLRLPDDLKTHDEALVFALQYVLARRSLLPDNRKQDGTPDDDLPF